MNRSWIRVPTRANDDEAYLQETQGRGREARGLASKLREVELEQGLGCGDEEDAIEGREEEEEEENENEAHLGTLSDALDFGFRSRVLVFTI